MPAMARRRPRRYTDSRMDALRSQYLVLLVAGALLAGLALLLRAYGRKRRALSLRPEDFLLEEAEITEAVGPGREGRAFVRKYGVPAPLPLRAREPGLAFPRGSAVRIIDCRDGCYLVEAADEEHLVR